MLNSAYEEEVKQAKRVAKIATILEVLVLCVIVGFEMQLMSGKLVIFTEGFQEVGTVLLELVGFFFMFKMIFFASRKRHMYYSIKERINRVVPMSMFRNSTMYKGTEKTEEQVKEAVNE